MLNNITRHFPNMSEEAKDILRQEIPHCQSAEQLAGRLAIFLETTCRVVGKGYAQSSAFEGKTSEVQSGASNDDDYL